MMDMTDRVCPTEDALRDYLAGFGEAAQVEALESHLSQCALCQSKIETIDHPSDSVTRLVRESVRRPPGSLPNIPDGDIPPIVDDRSQPTPSPPSLPFRIRDYQIQQLIGEGGMGHVYRAIHEKLNRVVAIKVLRRDRLESGEAIARFEREMQVVAKLDHPQIVRALDAGDNSGQPYLVMEFLEGVDLGRIIKRLGRLKLSEACLILQQVAIALHYAHEHKILHRDVKPSNVMVTVDGKVKLLDLGLAQILERNNDPRLSSVDRAVGTLAYMAPEQWQPDGAISARSDIYSLGVTFLEMLTGIHPNPPNTSVDDVLDMLSKRSGIDVTLLQLVRSMTSPHSDQRPSSMKEILPSLSAFTRGVQLSETISRYQRTTNRPGAPVMHSSTIHSRSLPVSFAPVAWSETLRKRLGVFMLAMSIFIMVLVFVWNAFYRTTLKQGGLRSSDPVVEALASPVDPDPRVPEEGNLEIIPRGDVAKQMLEDGGVFAWDAKNLKNHSLREGMNQLEPGTYTLRFDAPEDLEELADIRVADGGVRKVQLTTSLTKPFQFPSLPEELNTYAAYHGTLWRSGWPKDTDLAYNIRMQLVDRIEENDGRTSLWLKIEITTHQSSGDYIETAWLRIDEGRWRDEYRFEVLEGYVRASGNSIALLVDEGMSENTRTVSTQKSGDIVVKFDPQQDMLLEVAGDTLPELRLSIQDFIVLFFGDDQMSSANETIRKLRAELPKTGDRNAWIQPVAGSRGEVPCYVVSSRTRFMSTYLPGYMMARRKSEPFGFVRLEVNTPMMKALCVITSSGVGKVDTGDIDRIRATPVVTKENVQRSIAWDRATLPKDASVSTWHGAIELPNMPKQNIEITASAGGLEVIDGKGCRCVELQVASYHERGEDIQKESARIYVDEAAYKTRGDLVIKRGWFSFGDSLEESHVFECPANIDLMKIIEKRMVLEPDIRLQRFGVVDAISILFDKDFVPLSPFGLLRKQVKADRVGENPRRTAVSIAVAGGTPIPGELWTSPENSRASYRIRKSSRIPFSLVDITFSGGSKASIRLELKHHHWVEPGESVSDLVGADSELSASVKATEREWVEKSIPNWRVWTWEYQDRTYKAYAEYGGTTNYLGTTNDRTKVTVILRNRRGDEVRIPSTALDDDDWNWARKGREWKFLGKQEQDRQLLLMNEQRGKVTLQKRDSDKKTERELGELPPEDKEWIMALKESRKQPDDLEQQPAKWREFANFVR